MATSDIQIPQIKRTSIVTLACPYNSMGSGATVVHFENFLARSAPTTGACARAFGRAEVAGIGSVDHPSKLGSDTNKFAPYYTLLFNNPLRARTMLMNLRCGTAIAVLLAAQSLQSQRAPRYISLAKAQPVIRAYQGRLPKSLPAQALHDPASWKR